MARLTAETVAQARELMSLYPDSRSALVPICHLAQAQEGWLNPEAMEHIAEIMELTPAEVLGTASFYEMLRTEPVGRYMVSVCTNIACLLNGGYELLEHAEERLDISVGATTPDGMFTIEEAECIAYCDRAPCLQVNHRFFGPVSDERFDTLVEDLASGRLDDDVPPHGVLCRVRREGGLAVPAEQVRAERAAADQARDERAAAAQAERS
ncbi:MAG TPA: NAD(P)H-dependent oxidoreductase subunit E [Acidimicrobiales bacterium]|jgi:NADH-quinone oxidoreductase E subunit|nr:NAD(P)H-dependent oxidoreductase subunit E [Acidimicrobiales bacterium]